MKYNSIFSKKYFSHSFVPLSTFLLTFFILFISANTTFAVTSIPDASASTPSTIVSDPAISTTPVTDPQITNTTDPLTPTVPATDTPSKSQTQVQSQAAGLPPSVTPISLPTVSNHLSPVVDNLTGALVYKYNISVPPGRTTTTTPTLSLTYNSQDKADSVFGTGWSTNIPFIQTLNKKGVGTMYTDNYFSSSMDGELVSTDGITYYARVDTGSFTKYVYSANTWTVTDKAGTVYKFGNQAATRQDNSLNTAQTYRWMLEEVRDTNNNYITYEYYKDAGQIYPSKITYTGNGVTAGVFTVNFVREARTGSPTSFATGFAIKSNYRINEIRTEVSGVWARKYSLAYATSVGTLLLNSITESGQDDASVVTTLAPTTFDYQAAVQNWTLDPTRNIPVPISQGATDIGTRFADVNGDGLVDIVTQGGFFDASCGPDTNILQFVYLNTGTSYKVGCGWVLPVSFVNGQYQDNSVRLVDVNGDNLPDIIQYQDPIFGNFVWINNGSNWVRDLSWVLPIPLTYYGTDIGIRLADINGDGLVDIVTQDSYQNTTCGINNFFNAFINTGSGWTYGCGWTLPTPFFGTNMSDLAVRLVDVNGDGLVDLLRSDGVLNNGVGSVYINNGSAWVFDNSWFIPRPILSSGTDAGNRFGDVNGDGLVDIIGQSAYIHTSCGLTNNQYVYLNNGTGFQVSCGWVDPIPFLDYLGKDNSTRLVDINGDGVVDFAQAQGSNFGSFVHNNNSLKPVSYLTKITYPQGGNTTITYTASPQIKDASGNLLNPNLSVINNVVSQMTDTTGTSTQTHNYIYEGGRYYFNGALDKKFAGFSKVTQTDSDGTVTKNYFHQGNTSDAANGEYNDTSAKIGKIYRTEVYNSTGNVYDVTINKWDAYNIGTNHDFVKLIRSTVLNYDGNAGHRDTSTEYSYDNTNGNLIQKTTWGEVTGLANGDFTDVGTDKAVETISYATNATNYVIGLPSQDTVVDQNTAKVRESKYYYDTLALGSVGVGNQTKVEQWKTAATYINTQKTYNTTYGIVATDIDPRGKITSYIYDANNLYPATVTDPLTHTTKYVYDYSLGKPKQTTDQNNFVYQTIYDGLDRVLANKIPDFTTPFSPVTKTAYVYTDTPNAIAVQRTDYLDASTSADTYQYFDGLGRLIQERKEAEIPGNFNVKDTVYNNIGLVQMQSLPYTSTGSAKTAATGTTALYTTSTYDPLQRPLTQVDALGTTTYAYDDWKTMVTDRNGKVKNYYKDGYGNLIKVDEINGASTYTTNYVWDLNNKLTQITDALGNIRNFTYDGLGRRLTAQDLHASIDTTFGTWTFTFDDAGNITQTISPNVLTTNYTYNDINQILTEDTTGVAGTEATYTYSGCANGIGKLCSSTITSSINTSYTYDSNSNVVNEAKIINAVVYRTVYSYDRQANVLIITYPDNAQAKYTFNTSGLLEKIEQKESTGAFTDVISNFDYSPMNQIVTEVYPNTVTTTNTYDAAKMYRLTRKLTQNTVPLKLQDLNYTYDNENNITQIIDASNTNSSKTAVYVLDDLYRMTSATITAVATGQTPYTQTFTYDAVGNILTGPIGTYLYQGNTGVLKTNPHGATSINGVTYTYDSDGNLTGNGTLVNTWNYKDQLTQIVVGGVTVNDYYDHNGDRVWHKVGTASTYYPNRYYNIDTAGKKTKEVYAGNQLVATIETVSAVVKPYYVHTDQLNSINTATDAAGALRETLDYYPYGVQRISSGGAHMEKRQYIGQMYDSNSGLDYLNARYYKADIGRFVSQDPEFWATSMKWLLDPQNQNSYSYGRNNPITLSDPTGRSVLTDLMAGPIERYEAIRASINQGSYSPLQQSFTNQSAEMFPQPGDGQQVRNAKMMNFALSFSGGSEGNVVKGFWTKGDKSSAIQNALSHFEKHGEEFGLQNAKQYVEKARNFFNNPSEGTLVGPSVKGNSTIMYNEATNTLGVINNNGIPQSLFKPLRGIDYFKDNVKNISKVKLQSK
jgi:RHS repeat-associated protein